MTTSSLDEAYINARLACEIARNVLRGHDLAALIGNLDRADALGPFVDPTLYREKRRAMQEDREVFAAAAAFLRAWPSDAPAEAERAEPR